MRNRFRRVARASGMMRPRMEQHHQLCGHQRHRQWRHRPWQGFGIGQWREQAAFRDSSVNTGRKDTVMMSSGKGQSRGPPPCRRQSRLPRDQCWCAPRAGAPGACRRSRIHDDGRVHHGTDGNGGTPRLIRLEFMPSRYVEMKAISTPPGASGPPPRLRTHASEDHTDQRDDPGFSSISVRLGV